MSYQSMYDARRYPEGVPSPYVATVEPYPSYVHGANYQRPYFAEPWVQQPYNVLRGLGDIDRPTRTKSVLGGAAAGAGILALLAAVAVDTRKGRAVATGALLGGLVGLAASWTTITLAGDTA